MKDLKLYTNCKVVCGYFRDIIVDLERERFFIVPKGLTAMLQGTLDSDGVNVSDASIIKEYAEFLCDNELAFTPEPLWVYPETLKESTATYSNIANITWIIDQPVNEATAHKIIACLDQWQVQAILLVGQPGISHEEIKKILVLLSATNARCIEVVLEYNDLPGSISKEIAIANPRVRSLLWYHAKENYAGYLTPDKTIVLYSMTAPYTELLNRQIQQYHFTCNIKFYTEAVQYNPFYYKKIFVDSTGNVFPFANAAKSIGNITDPEILSLLQGDEAYHFSKIPKSEIDVCKDCEFRYICPDNRVPLQRPDKSWYHSVACNYNPYIAKWKGEKDFRSLFDCGVISDRDGFLIQTGILKNTIAAIWAR